ncbi:MAG: ABC transporter ATP-binding protein [Spirochaetaceae bacterium]|nr:ABC transporter ATP-binding protein [Spirochaetaceae bacterium]
MEQKSIIKAQGLYKEFNLEAGFFERNKKTVYAVNDVSFAISRGSTYGLVGESGCGKSTTARMIVSMYKTTKGEITFCDKSQDLLLSQLSPAQLRRYREQVKYIFQDPARSLNPRMTVLQVLTAALRYSSLWQGKEAALQQAEKIIQEVGLTAADLYRRPSEFSGGQRQRISIARGLIMEPQLLICDEVVSALDVSVQGQILNLLQDLRQQRDLSLLFITHDLRVACYFCDTIGVMYRGMLVEEAPAANLYKEAAHPYTKLLFAGAQGQFTQSNSEVKSVLEEELGCPFAHRCPYVMDKCHKSIPQMEEVAPGHKLRCWLEQ